jgi:hypothetical protein
MEQHLGRRLEKNEVVHHIDEDRTNDTLENLEIMALEAHTRFHATGETAPTIGVCPVCENSFTVARGRESFCSSTCFYVNNRVVARPSKEELRSLIYQWNFVQLGKRFGVSDNAVRKWCKAYGLPYKKRDILGR